MKRMGEDYDGKSEGGPDVWYHSVELVTYTGENLSLVLRTGEEPIINPSLPTTNVSGYNF